VTPWKGQVVNRKPESRLGRAMSRQGRAKRGATTTPGKLGTFAGVFTPSALTILGIILFRRLGYVVGAAGLGKALLIILLANVISILTSISVAAIATNIKVKGGGDYYLISRTLGLEFGGAIGIVLFLAQSVSIAFYCLGFGEALTILLPWTTPNLPRLIAAAATVGLFFLAWAGADWATRFQYGVMVVLILALCSFLWGGIADWNYTTLLANWSAPASGPSFWLLFAIFFPAVTGFTQGISMSGDLADPGRSIPTGTFLAVGISAVVYVGAAFLFSAGLSKNVLTANYESMSTLARFSWLIDAGVIAATLSSAMASFLGAPRILQALSSDKIFKALNYFSKGVGPTNNPRRGVLLSLAIALATVALGNLNLIAPIVSMFFLVSYGLLNYATYFEASAAGPDFRPRFRWFNRYASLAGAIACLTIMLAINPAAGVTAVAILIAIFQYLRRTAPSSRWADGQRSYSFHVIRQHLLSMFGEPEHPRDWRPQILAFSDHADERRELLKLAGWLDGGTGLTSVVHVVEGHPAEARHRLPALRDELRREIVSGGFSAFPLALAAPDLRTALSMLLQTYGIGPLRANIALLGWPVANPDEVDSVQGARREYGRYLREALRANCNTLALKARAEDWQRLEKLEGSQKRIDVWWQDDATSRLQLLLAYLMTRTVDWEAAEIRVLAIRKKITEGYRERLEAALADSRIEASPEIMESPTDEEIVARCVNSAMVFLPFALKGTCPVSRIGKNIETILEGLGVTVLVEAVEDIDLSAEPDEGEPAVRAAAADALEEAEDEAATAEEDALQAADAAAALAGSLQAEEQVVADDLRESERLADQARGKAHRARERVEKAAERAEAAGIVLPETANDSDESDD